MSALSQYYYKRNNCPAPDSRDPRCICWHNEGTGPFSDAAPGQDPVSSDAAPGLASSPAA